jgi:hypothetical protein
MRPGVFVVEDIESRQSNVGDFFLIESKCAVRRRSIARRTNGRSGRAACQRQRPGDSQYRYGFQPTLSLRTSLAMRHGGGLPFHPHLNVPIIHQRRPQRSVRTLDGHLRRRGSPNVRFESKADIELGPRALCGPKADNWNSISPSHVRGVASPAGIRPPIGRPYCSTPHVASESYYTKRCRRPDHSTPRLLRPG